jgi:hypothetical protein
MEPEDLLSCSQGPPVDHILSHMNPVHTSTPYFSKKNPQKSNFVTR